MSKFRIAYIASLVILGVLIAFTIFRPMVTGEQYNEVQFSGLIETEDEWIVEFQLTNKEGKDMYYTLSISADGQPYTSTTLVKDGRMFGFRYHIYPEMLTKGEISLAVYKEGEATPIEEVTYYLK